MSDIVEIQVEPIEVQEVFETSIPEDVQSQEDEPQEFIINREMINGINLLIQGVRKGQAAGCYTLQEASVLFAAIQLLTGGDQQAQEQAQEQSSDQSSL